MAKGRSGSRVSWYRDRERLRWSREWRVKGSVIGRATQCSSLFGVRGPSEQQHRLAQRGVDQLGLEVLVGDVDHVVRVRVARWVGGQVTPATYNSRV